MPLNLNEFIKKDDVIQIGDKEFIVTANIPVKKILDFAKYQSIDSEDPEAFKITMQWLKEMLYLKNDKNNVDEFVDNLTVPQLNKVALFIGDYTSVKEDDKEKKN